MKDSYGREIEYLRLSVTDLCNLRCKYCMGEKGICKKQHNEMLTEEEMIQAVKAAASLGIRKVRITGGDPLVKKNIISICEHIAEVEGIDEVCITTNAILLPQYATQLVQAGVTRINISLDTLDEDKYADITRGGKLSEALCGIEAALDAGFDRVKINTVLIGGFNVDEITKISQLTYRYPVDVRFIELMPMNGNDCFKENAYVNSDVVINSLRYSGMLKDSEEYECLSYDGVARVFKLEGAQGNVGLISPISCEFCNSCNRIRITADGKIKPCLHTSAEYTIKGLDEDEMKEQLRQAINAKPKWHGPLSYECISKADRDMNRIGG